MADSEMLDKLRGILEAPDAELTTPLVDVGWDSMGVLSVIALARTAGKVVTSDQAKAFVTVGDIVAAL